MVLGAACSPRYTQNRRVSNRDRSAGSSPALRNSPAFPAVETRTPLPAGPAAMPSGGAGTGTRSPVSFPMGDQRCRSAPVSNPLMISAATGRQTCRATAATTMYSLNGTVRSGQWGRMC